MSQTLAIPPFTVGSSGLPRGREPVPNLAEAERLARTIRFAWAACGHEVNVWIERRIGVHDRIDYDIRSDLVDGLPKVEG